jgi:ADP-ribose pyrophosphatase YjhB (NUDIX family)
MSLTVLSLVVSCVFNAILVIIGLMAISSDRWRELRGHISLSLTRKRPDIVVGVVKNGPQILLVHRKPKQGSRLHWQFPSGEIGGDGDDLQMRVVREVADETDVQARVDREIGRRVHPLSGRLCVYFLCQYVSGEAKNLDPNENIYVRWIDVRDVEAYLNGKIFSKAKTALGLSR